jgi:hypothetical protein
MMGKYSLAARLAWAGAAVAGLVLLAPPARAAEGWGTVKGQVVWGEKELPKPKKEKVEKDQEHCLSKGPIYSEALVVDPKTKGVKWAVVWLVDAKDPKKPVPIPPKLKAVPKAPMLLDQPCCKFEPHALALREGQTLIAKNSAPVAHNVNWTGGTANPGNNVIVPPGGQIEIKDLKAARFPVSISCNIHPWMKAWVRVFDHPYFAVTDKDGNFKISNLPPGKYTVEAYHLKAGAKTQELQVDGDKKDVNFELQVPAQ